MRQLTVHQQRILDCNATGRTRAVRGDERALRDRMASGNADAGTRQFAAAERRDFMRTCLSGETAAR